MAIEFGGPKLLQLAGLVFRKIIENYEYMSKVNNSNHLE